MYSEKLRNLFYLLIFFIPGILWTQAVWQSEQITDSKRLYKFHMDIALDLNGTVHIVYQKEEKNDQDQIADVLYISKNNGIWSDPINLGITGYGDRDPAVDVDGNGITHVIFSRVDPQKEWPAKLFYWNTTAGFGDPVEIANDLDPSLSIHHQDISIDDNGYLHIVFLGWGGSKNEAYYTNNISGNFMTPILIEPVTGNDLINEPRIDADENGKVGVIYSRLESGDVPEPNMPQVYYTSNASGPFIKPVLVPIPDPDPDVLSQSSEVKVSSGAAYVIYTQTNPDYFCCGGQGYYDVYYTKLDEATGSYIVPPDTVVKETTQFRASMDFQPSDGIAPAKIHISYLDFYEVVRPRGNYWESRLNYLVLNANDGSVLNGPEMVIDDGGDCNRISLDANNDAHIVFKAHGDVFYATNSVTAAGVMHIASVDVTTKTKGKNVNGVAIVTIVNEYQNPVEGASVSGDWSGLTSDSDEFQTGADGSGSCSSDKVDKSSSGFFTFTVTNVSKDGWAYDPSANVEDSDSAPWNTGFTKPSSDILQTVIPQTTKLLGNYPNPFNPSTRIAYQLAQTAYVELKIFNVNGQIVRYLVQSTQEAGLYSVDWRGVDDSGNRVASGIYIYELQAGNYISTQKMILAH